MSEQIIEMGTGSSLIIKRNLRDKGNSERAKRVQRVRAFSDQEAQFLLSYRGDRITNSQYYDEDLQWLIPLSLFTGLRFEELIHINLDNFITCEGINCLWVNDDHERRCGRRLIPIAQVLLDRGLTRYIQVRKEAGKTMLFEIMEHLPNQNYKRASVLLRRWFNKTVLLQLSANVSGNINNINILSLRRTVINKILLMEFQYEVHAKLLIGYPDGFWNRDIFYPITLSDLKKVLDKNLVWDN